VDKLARNAEGDYVSSETRRGLFGFGQDYKIRLGRAGDTAERLSPGASIIVIAGLSVLAWAVLIALAMSIYSLI